MAVSGLHGSRRRKACRRCWRSKLLRPIEGLRDVSTRWIVAHDLAEWKDEIAWMSLYFSAAVWASLALCVFYSLENHLPRYRTEATVASCVAEPVTAASRLENAPCRPSV